MTHISRLAAVILRGVPSALAVLAVQAVVPAQVSIVPPCPGGGAYPDFVFVQDTGPSAQANTMTIDLALATTGTWTVPFSDGRAVYDPQEWVVVLYYEDLVVPAGKTVRFRNHGSRAPVAMLATNSITVEGTIDVSGRTGDAGLGAPRYAEPGPGGFRGARGTPFPDANDTSSGFGPGGGLRNPGIGVAAGAGGSHGSAGGPGANTASAPRPPYGDPTLGRLVGGSGGGGGQAANDFEADGGGAGGGALLLATNGALSVYSQGRVLGDGGDGGRMADLPGGNKTTGGSGSGGAIRLVGAAVTLMGADAFGAGSLVRTLGGAVIPTGLGSAGHGGLGRIRIEKNNPGEFPVLTSPMASIEVGQVGAQPLFRSQTLSRIRISQVLTGANVQAVPVDPRAEIAGSPDLVLTGNATRTFVIEALDTPPTWNVTVRFTKAAGVAPQQEVLVLPTGMEGGLNWTRSVDVVLDEGIYAVQARAWAP